MKVLILGDGNSIHIIKWVLALHQDNTDIVLFSLAKLNHSHFMELDNFKSFSLQLNQATFKSGEGNFKKLSYFKAIPQVKTIIRKTKPDIVHAHYVSSYGLIGAMCGFQPFIVSVWGSDIYDFPRKNFVFKQLIKFTLKKASTILSTSKVMAKETKKYTNKNIIETPFGVDLGKFQAASKLKKKNGIVVGTIKSLEYKYGIDILIRAFAKLLESLPNRTISLHIVGEGSEGSKLQELAKQLHVTNHVTFLGKVDNAEVPAILNSFDIYCAFSRWDSESFGVAIVEAQACELPVIVSDKGGLPEVVKNHVTGVVIPSEDAEAATQAMRLLVQDKSLGEKYGKAGRVRVMNKYDWQKNVDIMRNVYTMVLSKKDEK